MRTKVFRFVKITAALLGVSLLTFLAVRIYDTQGDCHSNLGTPMFRMN